MPRRAPFLGFEAEAPLKQQAQGAYGTQTPIIPRLRSRGPVEAFQTTEYVGGVAPLKREDVVRVVLLAPPFLGFEAEAPLKPGAPAADADASEAIPRLRSRGPVEA